MSGAGWTALAAVIGVVVLAAVVLSMLAQRERRRREQDRLCAAADAGLTPEQAADLTPARAPLPKPRNRADRLLDLTSPTLDERARDSRE